jgi:hypothetical protein
MHEETDYIKEFFLSLNDFRANYPDGSFYEFKMVEVPVSETHPGGVTYSLIYVDAGGTCRVRFDNAHAVSTKGRGSASTFDHWHRFSGGELVPYPFIDLPTLFEDFYRALEAHLDPVYRSPG